MKHLLYYGLMTLTAFSLLTGCSKSEAPSIQTDIDSENIIDISLSDDNILVDGTAISSDTGSAVYAANDIVYYPEGQDFTYGEGTAEDAHSREEADAHTVVHITAPGTYRISGQLSAGQVAVDLGEEAEDDPSAVVNLVLSGAEINCSVAPAVIFYNVYECGDADAEYATKDVDTSKAGANVILADDSETNISGSYVARIYKSYELNDEGSEVIDSEKLHKYDAAFYSKMSMNILGEKNGSGILNINAENEGLDSELHLTLNGGTINITSGNDGINTNEDEVSVTTINAGTLNILVTGKTGEGDGIDSNGWLVINGGTVTAQAYGESMDSGIDSDMGIHINGGIVTATGNMLDRISESDQTYAVFQFMGSQEAGSTYTLKTASGKDIATYTPQNPFSCMVISSPKLKKGTYTLWKNDTQLSAASSEMNGGFGGGPGGPGGQKPGGMQPPEGMEFPEGEMPSFEEGEMPDFPEGEMPDIPQGERPGGGRPNSDYFMNLLTDAQPEFEIKAGGNNFIVVE